MVTNKGSTCLIWLSYHFTPFRISDAQRRCKEQYVNNDPKVCYITAIYGNYEASCKPFTKQSVLSDFICFTDSKNIESNGWIIDNTPYHIINKSPLDNDNYTNSISKNKHTFNIAKYYKQQFQNIPILKKYDIIIWLDGTIEINNPNVSECIISKIEKYKIIGWMHEHRGGSLKKEVDGSCYGDRYLSTFMNGQEQPYQDVNKQYETYVNDGYTDEFFKDTPVSNDKNKNNLGVWITCFVAFLNNDENVTHFLNLWYLQTLEYTTQDQNDNLHFTRREYKRRNSTFFYRFLYKTQSW